MAQRTWTLSNVISLSRVALLAPLAYCLLTEFEHNREWAVGIVILGVLSDFLDGYLARKLHDVSELGKIIDPLADKAAVGVLALLLVLLGDIPLWFFVVAVIRDLMILAGGIYIRRKKNIIAQSNWPGKVAVNFIALYLLLSALQWESLEGLRTFALWASLAMMSLSLFVYTRRLFIGRAVERGA